MRNLILFIAICITSNCFSQDTLTKRGKEIIQVKILEVNETEIKYKRFDNLEGPTIVVLKSDVLSIKYDKGRREVFNEDVIEIEDDVFIHDEKLYEKGKKDAKKYYKSYQGAGTVTLIVTGISPIVGLIPAIICSSTRPNENKFEYSDPQLKYNSDYYMGYTRQAKKIKQGRVWLNFGIGLVASLIAYSILAGPN